MALFYAAGTVSVAAGGSVVTGVGTFWASVLVAGDSFAAGGRMVPIRAISSNTSLTLELPWDGAALSGAGYSVRFDSPTRFEPAYLAERVRELVSRTGIIEGAVPYYRAQSVGLNTPPGSPALDDVHVVGTAPTGAWAGQAKAIAQWSGTAWQFTVPEGGWHAYSEAVGKQYAYVGGVWGLTDGVASVMGYSGVVTLTQMRAGLGVGATGVSLMAAGNAAEGRAAIGASATGNALIVAADAAAGRAAINAVNIAGQVMSGGLTATGLTAASGGNYSTLEARSAPGNRASLISEHQPGVGYSAIIQAADPTGAGLANFYFRTNGNLQITGAFSKGSSTFLTDSPLDPENRNVRHGAVEGPCLSNRYHGVVRLVGGVATADIDATWGMTPGMFAALNRDYHVAQLTNQEGFARLHPGPFDGGAFTIIADDPECGDLVFWEVVGLRNDEYARLYDSNCEHPSGRFIVEFEKD